MKIVKKSVIDLSIHPIIRKQPRMAANDPQFIAKVDEIERDGEPLQPIIIDKSNRIIDGRHRFWWTCEAGLEEIPCIIEQDESKVWQIVLSSLLGRRHYSKGAQAYLAYPLIAEAVGDGEKLRGKRKRGTRCRVSENETAASAVSGEKTPVERLAEQLGVSPRMLRSARKLEETFQENEAAIEAWRDKWANLLAAFDSEDGIDDGLEGWNAMRELFERLQNPKSPFLVANPFLHTYREALLKDLPPFYHREIWEEKLFGEKAMGIDSILKGIAGMDLTKGKGRADLDEEDPIDIGVSALHRVQTWDQPFRKWEKMTEADQIKVLSHLSKKAIGWPKEVKEAIGKAIGLKK